MTTITMQCIVCSKALEGCGSPNHTQPSNGLCFSGTPQWGSTKDNEHQNIGLDSYEIFVCDDCWETKRKVAVGVKLEPPTPRERFLFTGEQADTALARSKERRAYISVMDMFLPEED